MIRAALILIVLFVAACDGKSSREYAIESCERQGLKWECWEPNPGRNPRYGGAGIYCDCR